jgi:hypothetical protein
MLLLVSVGLIVTGVMIRDAKILMLGILGIALSLFIWRGRESRIEVEDNFFININKWAKPQIIRVRWKDIIAIRTIEEDLSRYAIQSGLKRKMTYIIYKVNSDEKKFLIPPGMKNRCDLIKEIWMRSGASIDDETKKLIEPK